MSVIASFGGLFFLTLYLAGKLHLYDQRGEVWKVFLCLIPTLGAALVAVSRIEDARHHPFDVLFGSALGVLCAWGSYRQYFPSLDEAWKKGQAYPIRSWGTEPAGPSDGHREREFARDEGRESLRATPLPQTHDEYESSYPQNQYHGSNVHKQIVRPLMRHDSTAGSSVQDIPFGTMETVREEQDRRQRGRTEEEEEEEEERMEMERLPRDHSAISRNSEDSPLVASLHNLQYNR